MQRSNHETTCDYLSSKLGLTPSEIEIGYSAAPRNVQVVLTRQVAATLTPSADRPVCQIDGEDEFLRALQGLRIEESLFTLARVYDEAHIVLCKIAAVAKRQAEHNAAFLKDPRVNVIPLASALLEDENRIGDAVYLKSTQGQTNSLQATWTPVAPMSFDGLPVLTSLSDLLPGEASTAIEYAGIGGGGGSDIVSASLLGHLLRQAGKEMNLLISTRTWRTGSQGKKGSKMGVKREIRKHGGAAMMDGYAVGGTYRITPETQSEGRDLEVVPVHKHEDVFIVLDQGEETGAVDEEEKADLRYQFRAVLSQRHPIDTVIVVDTGGDVFGGNSPNFSTPDQDIRVQCAMAQLSDTYPNLITAVLAPGVDAPADAPEKAKKAGGKVYKPTAGEKTMLLGLMAEEYQMDGSNPDRYGKTTLCLQERLKGRKGWVSLNLPEHVINTWENPWSNFVFIRECMSDVILMPLLNLLPLIDPAAS